MVFIGFQIWVLGMSLVALLNESIPHILASLATHMIATGWAAFQIQHTAHFREDFNRVITNGACNASLLPHYWDARAKAEIPSLALNIVGLIISAFLTWKLIKVFFFRIIQAFGISNRSYQLFGWQTFKRVGASLSINRIYKFVLFLSVTIQLSLFFMIVTVSLWVDQLMNSVIGDLASYQKLYKVASLITLAVSLCSYTSRNLSLTHSKLMIPWLMTVSSNALPHTMGLTSKLRAGLRFGESSKLLCLSSCSYPCVTWVFGGLCLFPPLSGGLSSPGHSSRSWRQPQ